MSKMPDNFQLEQAQYRLGTAISELNVLAALQPAPKDVLQRMPKIANEIQESIKLLDAYVDSVVETLPCPK